MAAKTNKTLQLVCFNSVMLGIDIITIFQAVATDQHILAGVILVCIGVFSVLLALNIDSLLRGD
jgi:hypothetical protein